jgi:hypothetical protein
VISAQLYSRNSALCSVLCAVLVSAVLAPASPAAITDRTRSLPDGCGPKPSWIASATLPQTAQDQFGGCFASSSNQAEAFLGVTNNRPYAELLTLSGAGIDPPLSSFSDPLAERLASGLSDLGPGGGASTFLLGPGGRATLAIDRPAPGVGQVAQMIAAPANAFAVGALAWGLLSSVSKQVSLPAATLSCVLAAVHGALLSPPRPERALRRIKACVNASGLPGKAEMRLSRLAARALGDGAFRTVLHREGSEPHRARIAFTIAPSNPNLINPEIHLGNANLGTLPSGRRTVRHLSASGGAPPYRFYIVPEQGGPTVPPWLTLAADGTLFVKPPEESLSVNFAVEVIDSNGEHSVVPY